MLKNQVKTKTFLAAEVDNDMEFKTRKEIHRQENKDILL